MTDTLKLKALIVEHGYTQKDVAKMLGLSAQSLNKKIHNKTEFKAREISRLCAVFGIENGTTIFFANRVDFSSTSAQC